MYKIKDIVNGQINVIDEKGYAIVPRIMPGDYERLEQYLSPKDVKYIREKEWTSEVLSNHKKLEKELARFLGIVD